MKNKTKILLLIFICQTILVFSQIKQSHNDYYNWFDEVVGVDNTSLFSGIVYKEKYVKLKENTNFFLSPRFLSGSVNYNGERYFNLEMKYDLFEEEILVRFKKGESGITVLKLIKSNVTEFSIKSHNFVQILSKTNVFEFYEVLLKNPQISVFKQHKKNIEELFFKERLYDNFKTINTGVLVLYKGDYHKVKSKKNLLNLFPKFKKEVKISMNKNKAIQKSNPDLFVVKVIEGLDFFPLNKQTL